MSAIVKSGVPGKVPTATQLDYGQLALNYTDEKVYFKNSANQIVPFHGTLSGRNKIINGKMEIAQRGTSFGTASSTSYSIDRYRWRGGYNNYTTSQDTSAPTGFFNSLKVVANAAAGADTSSIIEQPIEGFNARDLIDTTFVISFWVKSSKTGKYSVSLRNAGADRSYILDYTIVTANTWEFKYVVVPNGLITDGTWDWDTGIGLLVGFSFCGAQSSIATSTVGSWITGSYFYSTGHANALDTVGGTFSITGIQVETGTTPTAFEHRSYSLEFSLCQRYYSKFIVDSVGDGFCTGFNYLTTAGIGIIHLPVKMRIAPTAIEHSGTATDYQIGHTTLNTVCSAVPTYSRATDSTVSVIFTVASGLTAGQGAFFQAATVNAYLAVSAEF